MEAVPWTAYRSTDATPDMDNNKVTEGPLPETIPVKNWQMGSGRMHENAFAGMPQSQREASRHMGMKSDPRYNDDVNDIGDAGKDGDEQAKKMMSGDIPDGKL